ncbi:MAG: hypothetical protein ACREEM_06275 [Blastocatellia bacterium]
MGEFRLLAQILAYAKRILELTVNDHCMYRAGLTIQLMRLQGVNALRSQHLKNGVASAGGFVWKDNCAQCNSHRLPCSG